MPAHTPALKCVLPKNRSVPTSRIESTLTRWPMDSDGLLLLLLLVLSLIDGTELRGVVIDV